MILVDHDSIGEGIFLGRRGVLADLCALQIEDAKGLLRNLIGDDLGVGKDHSKPGQGLIHLGITESRAEARIHFEDLSKRGKILHSCAVDSI